MLFLVLLNEDAGRAGCEMTLVAKGRFVRDEGDLMVPGAGVIVVRDFE